MEPSLFKEWEFLPTCSPLAKRGGAMETGATDMAASPDASQGASPLVETRLIVKAVLLKSNGFDGDVAPLSSYLRITSRVYLVPKISR